MYLYAVTIIFHLGPSASATTLTIRRRAASNGAAISAVSAAFNALSNHRVQDPNDSTRTVPWLQVDSISAAEV